MVEAEPVCGPGLLQRNGAAAGLLITRFLSAEGDCAHNPVTRDDSGPFVIVEPAIAQPAARLEIGLQRLRQLVLAHRAIAGRGHGRRQRRACQSLAREDTPSDCDPENMGGFILAASS